MLNFKVKYFNEACRFEKKDYGDWIDLRSAKDIEYKSGDFFLVPLGVAMELPLNHEAHVLPRSSTFKNFGLIMTNSMGIIDNSYCGDNDQWFAAMLAMRDGKIEEGDRICQFRVMQKMPRRMVFKEVETLGNADRGGHGSTGIK